MSFVIYDLTFLVLFTLAVVIFLYTRKHNLKRQGLMYLYRTQVGVKFIEVVSKKYARILKPMQYLIVACGYFLMVTMIWFLAEFTYTYTKSAFLVRAVKIPPLLPLVPYLPELFKVDFLPPFYFTYWIVIIAIIAVSHEFAHGIFARLNKIKVESTGFGFLGPFLAAFVEPNEKQMNKSSTFAQLSILAAGTFANIVMAILFGLIFWAFFTTSFAPAGVNFNTYSTVIVNASAITAIAGMAVPVQLDSPLLNDSLTEIKIGNLSYFAPGTAVRNSLEKEVSLLIVYEDAPALRAHLKGPIAAINGVSIITAEELRTELRKYSPGETVTITTIDDAKRIDQQVTLGEREGLPYLGIGILKPSTRGISGLVAVALSYIRDPSIYYAPTWGGDFAWFIYHLLWWTVLINISVALVNMLPVGIFDGGRFFYLTVKKITGSEKFARKAFSFSTWLILAVFVWLMVRWAIAFI